ncbi:MAG: hypothetical protein AB1817_03065 [Chloroflexota bacterium]
MQKTPEHHVYPLEAMALFLSLVLSAAASLRGAGRAIEVMVLTLQLPFVGPSWWTGRLWLLRLGCYKLTRPKPHADDWVWIVDHTVQVGPEKCWVILGVRLGALPPGEYALRHEDVEPIELVPVRHSNGTVVYQQLEQAVSKTGLPREILSDHGTDLQAGIAQFCQQHPQTSAIYDIKHKTAAILKRELEHDADWCRFTQLANQSKQRLQQTALAAWAPPHQKTQARYLNVEVLVAWGRRLLAWFDQPLPARARAGDPVLVQDKLGWVMDFRGQLDEWGELFELMARTESFVRHQGLYADAHLELEKRLPPPGPMERTRRVRGELIAFVTEQEAQAHPNERLLGSSEVIESVLGKMKRLERDQSKNGFTGLLLSLGAIVATTTTAVIQKALETVSTQQVWDWCQKTLGQSVQSKRRAVLVSPGRMEQKRDQRLAVT